MNDNELLRLAAQAADLCVLEMHGRTDGKLYDSRGSEWDPLTDDGDAGRLAADLCLDIDCSFSGVILVGLLGDDLAEVRVSDYAEKEERRAAWRRAVTTGAAKIVEVKAQ